jgi:DNA-3-methyladenine glycosylase I
MPADPDLVRCPWANPANPVYVKYHDEEWGVSRRRSDREWFELLVLEGFQAGLSWETILNKRDAFRRAFRRFELAALARMGPRDVQRLMKDASIVRNRAKIEAAIANARAALGIVAECGSLAAFFEGFRPPSRKKPLASIREIPCSSPESEALSRALRKSGFRFVGPVIVYSLMQATGLVNDHVKGCFRAATGHRRPDGKSRLSPLAVGRSRSSRCRFEANSAGQEHASNNGTRHPHRLGPRRGLGSVARPSGRA